MRIAQRQSIGGSQTTSGSRVVRESSVPAARAHGLGNQAMQRLLQARAVQAKLTVNQPGDRFEREADRVAEFVMRMPDSGGRTPPHIQRMCAECEEEVQRKASSPIRRPATDAQVPAGAGRPLPAALRSFFEPRFGRDFGHVRIHTDSRAADSARALNATAYTAGNDIVFAEGEFAPGTRAGGELLAHELTHTVQQAEDGRAPMPVIQRTIGDGHDLQAPRLSGNVELEAAFDDERLIQRGRRSAAVRLIQESLLAQGYTFPGFGADGIFGPETEAVVRQFQTDVGAAVDGIVGPETMSHLDVRDPSNLAGIGPVAKVGPLAGPRPAPARGCDASFQGVTFTLANQIGAGVAPAAAIGITRVRGRHALVMQGRIPATYQPQVTINAPSNARAQEFEVGIIQNLLTDTLEYRYTTGVVLRSTLPVPIKDGAPIASGVYHTIFAENGGGHPGILVTFPSSGATVQLNLPDTPSDFAFVNLFDNPECVGQAAAATLTNGLLRDDFRTWVGVRHRPSGCVRTIHHIDWTINWSATVNGAAAPPTAAVTSNVLNVTEPDGNGSPTFIQGGRVPADLLAANRVCGP